MAGSPTNNPFGKENDLNQTSRELCSMLIFRGVCCEFLLDLFVGGCIFF